MSKLLILREKLKYATVHFDQIKEVMKKSHNEIVYFQIGAIYTFTTDELNKLRLEEQGSVQSVINGLEIHTVISYRYRRKIEAMLSLFSILLLTFVLLYSIYLFNKDMYKMILNPLERMIQKLKKVAEDPIGTFKSNMNQTRSIQNEKQSSNETMLIENAIYKISELLVLGFGQAGSKIITQYVFDKDKDIDQIGAGEMVQAIFGFCDIRNFTDATEVLLEEVMMFVNSIAEIVHSSVDEFKYIN